MNTPSKCRACGSSDLIWFILRNTGGAQGEPLRMPEIAYDFILGCKECSETLRVLRADDVAEYLTLLPALPAQERAQSAAVSGAQAAQSASDDVFEEGQWWLEELDSIVANGTPTQRRAMAVVRNLLSCWQRVQAAAVPKGWSIQRVFNPSGYTIQMPDGGFCASRTSAVVASKRRLPSSSAPCSPAPKGWRNEVSNRDRKGSRQRTQDWGDSATDHATDRSDRCRALGPADPVSA